MTERLQTAATAIAYAAGLFDGEGCVTITRQHNQRHGPSGGFHLQLRLNMTHELGVRRFREIVGVGTLNYHVPHDDVSLPTWMWFASRRDSAEMVLRLFREHLVVKAREADIALRFLQVTSIPERHRLFLECRRYKTKGLSRRRAA